MTPVPQPRSFRPLLVGAYTLGAFFFTLFALGVLAEAKPGSEEDLVTLVMSQALGYAVMAFVALRLHGADAPLRDFVALTAPRPVHVAVGLVSGAGLYPLLSKLDDLVAHRMPASQEEREAMGRILATDTVAQKVVLAVCLLVVLPMAVELFYRGVLFSVAEPSGTQRAFMAVVSASVASSLLYSSSLRALPSIFGFAVLAASLRALSRSVVPSVLAHLAFFGVPLVPALLLRDYEERYSWPMAAVGAVVAVAVWFVGFALRRSAPAPEPLETI